MSLSIEERGILEKTLDITVKNGTSLTKMWSTDDMSKSIGINSEIDFSIGFLLGDIMKGYWIGFKARNRRHLDKQEQDEFWDIVVSRMPQIKDSIHQAG